MKFPYNSNTNIKKNRIISIPNQIKSFASVFLAKPHFVSGYYGTIVERFSSEIFDNEHKCPPYYVSALCYYKIEQLFRSGDLNPSLKKARFHLMMLVRMLAIGESLSPFNSNAIDKECERFKRILLDEEQAQKLFKIAEQIFNESSIDKEKKQYKSETDTKSLLDAFRAYNKKI